MLSYSTENLCFFILRFDVSTNCLFIGDANGRITLLSFAKSRDLSSYEFIRQLHGHTKCVTSMCWDSVTSRLISSSVDNSVILWDVGGGKGTAYELQVSYPFHSINTRYLCDVAMHILVDLN